MSPSRASARQAADLSYALLMEAPTAVDAHEGLLWAFEALGQSDDAASVWLSLAQAFAGQRKLSMALGACREALVRNPRSLQGLFTAGQLHLAADDMLEAIRSFEALLVIDRDHADAHIHIGIACHSVGDVDRGWKEFRWRFHTGSVTWRTSERRLWDGSPLAGRTILLWAEHGLGDTIQFLRYVAPVRASGGRVIVECDRRLEPLVRGMPEVWRTVARGAPLPEFDVHAPLLLLPSLLESSAAEAGVPYLRVDERLKAQWRRRVSSGDERLIGLSWGGKPTSATAPSRFAPLAAFSPLAELPRTRVVSLQQGPWAAERTTPPPGLHMEQLQDRDCSLADAAALIENLDLVITVDTMIAHLAGALGKPVWTLLPLHADWRWLRRGDRSHLYPTMKLFRRSRADTWSDVIARVRTELDSRPST